MVYKIFKKNNYIVVIDDRNFYYEEHCSAVLVLKRLSTDTTYDIVFVRPDNVPQAFYSVPFADIRDEFNNPYASVAAWETWYTTNTGCQGDSGSASTLASILATLQAQSEVEGVFVKDTANDKVVLQVRVWDQDSQTFINTLYFNPDGTPYTPVGTLEWVGTSGSTNSIITGPLGQTTTCGNAVAVTLCQALYDEMFNQGDDLSDILDSLSSTGIVISSLPAITGSVSVSNFPATQNVAITGPLGIQANCANGVSVTLCQDEHDALLSIKNAVNSTLTVALNAATLTALETINAVQSGSWTVALDAATLSALETINVVQSGTWTVAVSTLPAITGTVALDTATLNALENITVSGTVAVSSLPPITGNVTVSATDLDIRDLAFATDRVDVTGSSVKLQDNAGTPITSTTIGADTGVDVNVIGPVNPSYITPVSGSRYKRTVGNTSVTYIAGAISLSIQNIGNDNVTVDTDTDTGEILDPGVSITWDAPVGRLLNAFSFKGTSASSTYVVVAVYP